MRLLNIDSLELEEYVGRNVPPYTILSHTWGLEEVTFRDLQKGGLAQLVGLRKLQSLCDQTRRDGYQYTWIDTCCIDKSSSAELAESINSMYEWYSKAKICYVYLSDVRYTQGEKIDRNSMFYRSRWFTRGWTLQELLAPSLVIFFDTSWCLIGTRKTLLDVISETTGIPPSCLSGTTVPAEFSVATRFSWASKRTCTRKEDVAYSLMGLFDINMPLFYGEGERAFLRLQEEIVKHNNDQSILSWDVSDEDNRCWRRSSVFAQSPADFTNVAGIHQFTDIELPPYCTTSRGLSISLPLDAPSISEPLLRLLKDCNPEYSPELQAAYLNCGPDAQHVVQIFLVSSCSSSLTQSSSPTFQRLATPLRLVKLRQNLDCKKIFIEIASRELRQPALPNSTSEKNPTQFNSGFGSEHNTLVGTVVDMFNEEMVSNISGRSFIPEGILNGALDDVMLKSLQGLSQPVNSTGETMEYSFFPPRCRRIFAILALSDLLHFFPEIIGKLGVSDECLPMPDPELLSTLELTIGNEKGEHLMKWKSVTCLFGIKASTRLFFENQWCVLAPVFKNARRIQHCSLSQNHILPFIRSISGAAGKVTIQAEKSGLKSRNLFGIQKVYIHPDHYDFGQEFDARPPSSSSTRTPSRFFAVKELRGYNRQEFQMEKDTLECLRKFGSRNILELLATYEVRANHLDETHVIYNMVFPWAESDLKTFWESDEYVRDKEIVPWIAEQCWKLADALSIIHTGYMRFDSDSERIERFYGIHGGIEPAKIFRFTDDSAYETKNRGRLVISDFGLANFHHKDSRSRVSSTDVGYSVTYSAPELMLEGNISGKVDIWALGCVFLEFITWFLMGSESVNCKFPERRIEADTTLSIRSDKFFQVYSHDDGRPPVASVKNTVLRWMDDLRNSDGCSNYFKNFLDLISARMLIANPRDRIQADELSNKLKEMYEKGLREPRYYHADSNNRGSVGESSSSFLHTGSLSRERQVNRQSIRTLLRKWLRPRVVSQPY